MDLPQLRLSGKLNRQPTGKSQAESTRWIEMRRRLPGQDGYWLIGKSCTIKPIPRRTDPFRGDRSSNRRRVRASDTEGARAYNRGRDLHPEEAVP
jgi:hypothetical protein